MSSNGNAEISLPTLRIVCGALIGGQVLFAGVVAFLRHGSATPFEGADVPYLQVIAAAMAVAIVPVAFLLRGRKFAEVAAETDARRRTAGYATAVVLFFALLEGVSLFNIVTWLLVGELVPPVAIVVLVLAIQGASFPSQAQLEDLGR